MAIRRLAFPGVTGRNCCAALAMTHENSRGLRAPPYKKAWANEDQHGRTRAGKEINIVLAEHELDKRI